VAKANDYSNQQPLSPIAKLLVDTIRCVRQGANVPRSFLLSGPPGVGKTHAVRLASQASIHNTKLVSLRGSELLAKGSSNPSEASRALKREFERAALMLTEETKQDGVILVFLDECDALMSVEPIAAMFAKILDRLNSAKQDEGWGRLIVIAATNRVDSLPAMLRRAGRLEQEIPIAPPNALERATILQSLLEGSSYLDSSKANNGFDPKELRRISEICVGYVPADLTALVRRAALLAVQADAENISPAYLEQAMGDVGASALRDASLSAPPKTTWDDIAGDPGGAKVSLQYRQLILISTFCLSNVSNLYRPLCAKRLSGLVPNAAHIRVWDLYLRGGFCFMVLLVAPKLPWLGRPLVLRESPFLPYRLPRYMHPPMSEKQKLSSDVPLHWLDQPLRAFCSLTRLIRF
jgi:MoxR-like ATPase